MASMDRRRFLIGSAALLASRARAQTDTINTGFIGTGSRGKGLLRSVLRQPGVKVTAICDIDPVHRDEGLTAAQEHSPESFTDYRRLLEKKDVHAVFIATPADLHVEMAIAAIQAGKHIYCEKPVGITPQSISALLKAARGLKTVFQVGQ